MAVFPGGEGLKLLVLSPPFMEGILKKLVFVSFVFFISGAVFSLPAGWHKYLLDQCDEVGVPVSVVYAILRQENPELNPLASHKNVNGTTDLGLFQLNDRYIDKEFVPNYWDREDRFQWSDPFHSTYIAVRHIKWLYDLFWQEPTQQSKAYGVALAYNCGYYAVVKGEVPAASVRYAVDVVNSVWRAE